MTDLLPTPEGYPIKLVRDDTPLIINTSGRPGELFYRRLHIEEAMKHLKLKLSEEVAEYLLADGEGIDELVDIHAVVESLAWHLGVDLDERLAEDERGTFRRPMMMYGRHPEFDT